MKQMADPLTSLFHNKENHKINRNPREHTASNEKGTYKPVCLLWCLLSWSERENLRSQSLKSHWYGFSPWGRHIFHLKMRLEMGISLKAASPIGAEGIPKGLRHFGGVC